MRNAPYAGTHTAFACLLIMRSPVIIAGGYFGRLFEGTVEGTFCFVPEQCISTATDHETEILDLAYVHSGWDVRNMRFSDVLSGQHLFPDAARPVIDFSPAPVRTFLYRIGSIHRGPRFEVVYSSN